MERLARTVLVIFGITGDLSRRKLLPALFRLERSGLLPAGFRIVGISRRGTEAADILELTRQAVGSEADDDVLQRLGAALSMVDMKIDERESYEPLVQRLQELETEAGQPLIRMFYLAIPSTLFGTVTERLSRSDINTVHEGRREARFLVEKPFGYDMKSAQSLVNDLNRLFDPAQIYRIDHYLAKETAQNILAFRFENPLFCKAWNNRHVSHIMITASEAIGIEGRTAFYEHMGALRDLVQSHLLQLLALITMRKPASMQDSDIHAEKERILARVMPPEPAAMPEETVRGQYDTYRLETDKPDSKVETYAAMKLTIDDDAWRGVPVFIRTGKALASKVTEINMVFSGDAPDGRKNVLTMRIQPNEGIAIDLVIKRPGFDRATEDVQLDFCYRDKLALEHPEAYERVLYDAMRGDRTLFATNEEVLQCWRVTEPILQAWSDPDFPLEIYPKGSAGPEAADRMIEKSGISWFTDSHDVCPLPRKPLR